MREENTLNALETQARRSKMGRLGDEFPAYYVEEVPYTEITMTALEPQATGSMRGGGWFCGEFPTYYVEEVPYMDLVSHRTYMVIKHHEDIVAMNKGVGNTNTKAVTPGKVATSKTKVTLSEGDKTRAPPSNRTMHGHIGASPPFLHATQLDLVFEL
jgi:hypothetical protein